MTSCVRNLNLLSRVNYTNAHAQRNGHTFLARPLDTKPCQSCQLYERAYSNERPHLSCAAFGHEAVSRAECTRSLRDLWTRTVPRAAQATSGRGLRLGLRLGLGLRLRLRLRILRIRISTTTIFPGIPLSFPHSRPHTNPTPHRCKRIHAMCPVGSNSCA